MATVICLVNNILKNVVFCVQQKLLTSGGWVHDDRIFIFWVNYLFKLVLSLISLLLTLSVNPVAILAWLDSFSSPWKWRAAQKAGFLVL